jgi:starch phosphorylase
VDVEFYYGILKSVDSLTKGYRQTMTMAADQGDGGYLYQCELPCRFSGRYGFTARVLPRGDAWMTSTPGFITWA